MKRKRTVKKKSIKDPGDAGRFIFFIKYRIEKIRKNKIVSLVKVKSDIAKKNRDKIQKNRSINKEEKVRVKFLNCNKRKQKKVIWASLPG